MASKKSAKNAKVVKITKPASGKQSTAEFIRSQIKAGKLTDAQILAAARKRAPKQKIGDNYVSWYRCQLKNAA